MVLADARTMATKTFDPETFRPHSQPGSPALSLRFPPRLGRAIPGLLAALLAPAAFLILATWAYFTSFFIRVRIHLDRWPTYNDPDPHTIPPDFLPGTGWIDGAVALLVLATGGLALWWRIARPAHRDGRPGALWQAVGALFVVALASWCLSLAFFRLDPGGMNTWLLD